jgi:hypothetical protein
MIDEVAADCAGSLAAHVADNWCFPISPINAPDTSANAL